MRCFVSARPPPPPLLAVGTEVSARFMASRHGSVGRLWYQGRVAAVHEDGTYHITYDDGDQEDRVKRCFVEPRLGDDVNVVVAPAVAQTAEETATLDAQVQDEMDQCTELAADGPCKRRRTNPRLSYHLRHHRSACTEEAAIETLCLSLGLTEGLGKRRVAEALRVAGGNGNVAYWRLRTSMPQEQPGRLGRSLQRCGTQGAGSSSSHAGAPRESRDAATSRPLLGSAALAAGRHSLAPPCVTGGLVSADALAPPAAAHPLSHVQEGVNKGEPNSFETKLLLWEEIKQLKRTSRIRDSTKKRVGWPPKQLRVSREDIASSMLACFGDLPPVGLKSWASTSASATKRMYEPIQVHVCTRSTTPRPFLSSSDLAWRDLLCWSSVSARKT